MLRIGLTGGIGSGKTTVARIFETLGIPVYYADDAAKQLMQQHKGLQASIIQHFGKEVYPSGKLNRAYLASVVFGNPEKIALLNSLVHPITILDAERWMKDPCGNGAIPSYALKEAALIFESGVEKKLDYVIGVSSPEELRINRTIYRDGLSREEVLKRMSGQMDESQKMNRCHFIIINNDQKMIIPQVLTLHQKLLELSASKN